MGKMYFVKGAVDSKINATFVYKYTADFCGDTTLRLSSAYTYKLFVNGNFIAAGPTRAPLGYFRPDEFKLNINDGDVISILTCDYNADSYCFIMQEPFFYCKISCGDKYYSASDFECYDFNAKVKNVERFSFQRGFTEVYKLSYEMCEYLVYPEKYFDKIDLIKAKSLVELPRRVAYATHYIEEIKNGYSGGDVDIDRTAEVKIEHLKLSDHIGFDKQELYEQIGETASKFVYTKGLLTKNLTEKTYATYDFGRIVSGFIGLNVVAHEDSQLYVIGEEMCEPDGTIDFSRGSCSFVFKWEIKKGKHILETLEPYTLKPMQVVVLSGNVRIESVFVRTWENPDAYNFNFKFSDDKHNLILKAAKNTLAQNSIDLLMDCPGRERSGWINDMYFSLKSCELLMQNTTVALNSLENYILAKNVVGLSDDIVPMAYPADHLNGNYIPNCILWFVSNVCEYYLRNGDEEFKILAESKVLSALEYFKKYENEYGLLENLDKWVFVEWSRAGDFTNGVNFPTNMQYYQSLKLAGEVYDKKDLIEKAQALKETIIKVSFNGKFFEDHVVREDGVLKRKNHITEVCQYYAYLSGITDSKSFDEWKKMLVNEFGPYRKKDHYPEIDRANVIIGLLIRSNMLIDFKEFDRVKKEMTEIFYPMAERTSTLWENVDDRTSLNHCIASYVALILYKAEKGQGRNKGE